MYFLGTVLCGRYRYCGELGTEVLALVIFLLQRWLEPHQVIAGRRYPRRFQILPDLTDVKPRGSGSGHQDDGNPEPPTRARRGLLSHTSAFMFANPHQYPSNLSWSLTARFIWLAELMRPEKPQAACVEVSVFRLRNESLTSRNPELPRIRSQCRTDQHSKCA